MAIRFGFTNEFCDRIEKIVKKKFTRGGQKIMEEAINILEKKIKMLEEKQ
jgi:hypothetical protein